jgi:hypothetical protein
MNFKTPLVFVHLKDTYFCHLEKEKQTKEFLFEKLAVQKKQGLIAPTTFAGTLSKKLFGIKKTKL